MKSRALKGLVAFGAAIAIVGGGAAGARADVAPSVTISDPALASCTATALGDAAGTTTFAPADLSSLTALSCTGVADVSQINDYSGLTSLDLSHGTIQDATPIASLTGLTTLSLDVNDITDLRPLSALTATISAIGEKYVGTPQTVGQAFALPTIHGLDGSAVPTSGSQFVTFSQDGTMATTSAAQASITWGDPTSFSVGWTITSGLGTISPTPASSIGSPAAVGQRLTATPGNWGSGVSLSYQWLLNGAPIAGATSTQYTVPAAAIHRSISVETTGAEDGYKSATVDSTPVTVASGTLAQSAPVILGTPTVFKKLTVQTGTWSPSPVTFTYQWLRNGVAISKATATSYALTASDANRLISVRVTGHHTAYVTAAATSAAVKAAPATLTRTVPPLISGSPATGNVLGAVHGTWSPSGVVFTYRWNRNGKAIAGGTKSTYKLTASDLNQQISVEVTGSKPGYASATRFSGAVKSGLGTIHGAPVPKVSGSTNPGKTLTANLGTWPGGVTVVTQWRRNGATIGGATARTYVVQSSDVGASISVVAYGMKTAYKTVAEVSAGHTITKPAPPAPTCTNGTYVNSAGHTVCRPEAAPSPPAGATAKCNDGTYSFSESRRGTCSGHGGVAEWL